MNKYQHLYQLFQISLSLFILLFIPTVGQAADFDGDGIDDSVDICQQYYDPAQEDSNNDGVGDACDANGVDYILNTIAGTGDYGFNGDGGQAISAQLAYPAGLIIDSAGNLYIADTGNHSIRKITPEGIISTIAGTGIYGFSGDGGQGTLAQLNFPAGLIIDSAGNFYIADSSNHRIRKITPEGIISTIAGTGVPGFSGDGGQASEAQLNFPDDLTIDSTGNLYIADSSNNRIRKITPEGIISTIAGTGDYGFSGDGEQAILAQFKDPQGLTIDSTGNLYIADRYNFRIRKITPEGIISTIAGTGVSGFSGDGGPATLAQLESPEGSTIDSAGNLYIADTENHRIRKITPEGIISTIAGTGISGFSGDGGQATLAQLNFPGDLTVDSTGNLYIADRYNNRIGMVTPALSDTDGDFVASFKDNCFFVSNTNQIDTDGDTFGNECDDDDDNDNLTDSEEEALGSNPLLADTDSDGLNDDIEYIIGTSLLLFDTDNDGLNDYQEYLWSTNPLVVDTDGDYDNDGVNDITDICPVYYDPNQEDADDDGIGDACDTDGVNYIIDIIAGTGEYAYYGDGGQATLAQLNYPEGATIDSLGNFYVADTRNHRIRKITPEGIISTIAGTGVSGFSGDGGLATRAQLNSPENLAIDSEGNLYLANTKNHRIRKITPEGIINTIAGTGVSGFSGDGGQAALAQLANPEGLTIDSTGNLYLADRSNNRIRKITPEGIISTIAGTGVSGFSGDGGPATLAQFKDLQGLTVDSTGTFYIVDRYNHRIRKITPEGIISTIAGTGDYGFSGDDGLATLAQLKSPEGSTIDSTGNLYIADTENHRIRKITPEGIISTIAGTGVSGFSGDDGQATLAQLAYPTGLTIDSAGNLYIADRSNSRIRKITLEGIISTIAGTGVYSFSGDGGQATSAQLYRPRGLIIDSMRNLYLADSANHRIRKITPEGIISTIAGTGDYGFSGDGGQATLAQLAYPEDLTIDGSDNIYIADRSNNRIRKITPEGIISTIAGTGDYGFNGDGGLATLAQLKYPQGLTIDSAGTFYIVDRYNSRIRKITTEGIISTIAGTGDYGFSGDDGPATLAQLESPEGSTIDSAGNFYIADTENHRIRKITPEGIISTIAGTGISGFSGDDGQATSAQLNYPRALTIDSAGNLYIADTENKRIRKVTPEGLISTIAGTGDYGVSGDGGNAALAQLNFPHRLIIDSTNNLYISEHGGRIRKLTKQLADTDNDFIASFKDNCVSIANTNQLNTDNDDNGNACDSDDDNDSLPDDWEIANNLNPLDAHDASLDSDNDGLTNIQEYLEGTDPQVNQITLELDTEGYIWTTSGDVLWDTQNTVYYTGNSALQSGSIGNGEQSSVEITVTGVGSISFYWKVSSESGADFLKFYIDGNEVASIDGEVEWQKKTFNLTPEEHTLRWTYIKDSAYYDGFDTGWLDGITTKPGPIPIVPVLYLL